MRWCDRPENFLPFPFFGICRDEKDFAKELRKFKITENVPFMPDGGFAATHTFHADGKVVCMVCIGSMKGRSKSAVYGLIAHEAVHIWQKVREMIGETSPSSEFEAYTVQFICTQLFQAYEDSK